MKNFKSYFVISLAAVIISYVALNFRQLIEKKNSSASLSSQSAVNPQADKNEEPPKWEYVERPVKCQSPKVEHLCSEYDVETKSANNYFKVTCQDRCGSKYEAYFTGDEIGSNIDSEILNVSDKLKDFKISMDSLEEDLKKDFGKRSLGLMRKMQTQCTYLLSQYKAPVWQHPEYGLEYQRISSSFQISADHPALGHLSQIIKRFSELKDRYKGSENKPQEFTYISNLLDSLFTYVYLLTSPCEIHDFSEIQNGRDLFENTIIDKDLKAEYIPYFDPSTLILLQKLKTDPEIVSVRKQFKAMEQEIKNFIPRLNTLVKKLDPHAFDAGVKDRCLISESVSIGPEALAHVVTPLYDEARSQKDSYKRQVEIARQRYSYLYKKLYPAIADNPLSELQRGGLVEYRNGQLGTQYVNEFTQNLFMEASKPHGDQRELVAVKNLFGDCFKFFSDDKTKRQEKKKATESPRVEPTPALNSSPVESPKIVATELPKVSDKVLLSMGFTSRAHEILLQVFRRDDGQIRGIILVGPPPEHQIPILENAPSASEVCSKLGFACSAPEEQVRKNKSGFYLMLALPLESDKRSQNSSPQKAGNNSPDDRAKKKAIKELRNSGLIKAPIRNATHEQLKLYKLNAAKYQ